MKIKYTLLFILPLLWSCTKDEVYIDVPLQLNVPSNFPPLAYNISQNPPTEKGFELGKRFFTMVDCLRMAIFLLVFVIFNKMLLHTMVTR